MGEDFIYDDQSGKFRIHLIEMLMTTSILCELDQLVHKSGEKDHSFTDKLCLTTSKQDVSDELLQVRLADLVEKLESSALQEWVFKHHEVA